MYSVKNMINVLADLDKAKNNVKWLVDNPDGLADMHGIEYWASEIVRLRKEVKKAL